MITFYKQTTVDANQLNYYGGLNSTKPIILQETFTDPSETDGQTVKYKLTSISVTNGIHVFEIIDGRVTKVLEDRYTINPATNSITFNIANQPTQPANGDPGVIVTNNAPKENRLFYGKTFTSNVTNSAYERIWVSNESSLKYYDTKIMFNDFKQNYRSNKITPVFKFHRPVNSNAPVAYNDFDPSEVLRVDDVFERNTGNWYVAGSGFTTDSYVTENPPENSIEWVDKLIIPEIEPGDKFYFWVRIEIPANQPIETIESLTLDITTTQEDINDMFA